MTHQNPDPHGTERVVGRAYAWEVGQELRAEREKHGLTPAQVVDRSSAQITEDTLLAYENGTLPVDGMVVMRIYEAFDADPTSALLRANHRALARAAVLAVDLTALTDTDAHIDDRLRPLQRWAAQRVRDQHPGSDATVRPAAGEWERLAQLCGLDRADLVQLLFDAGIAT